MINIFANSTTFGQNIGVTFMLGGEYDTVALNNKRVTPHSECVVKPAVYEKVLTADKVAEYLSAGKNIGNLQKATDTENKRVGSLNALVVELDRVVKLESKDMIMAYIPEELAIEFATGKHKFYLNGAESTYYSAIELGLWAQFYSLYAQVFTRFVVKNIAGCKKNVSNTKTQADRVSINSGLEKLILDSFRAEKANRTVARTNSSTAPATEDAFGQTAVEEIAF